MSAPIGLMMHLHALEARIKDYQPVCLAGMVTKIAGLLIEAIGLTASIGSLAQIKLDKAHVVTAEVVGFSGAITYLIAYGEMTGIIPGNPICPLNTCLQVPVSDALLGRVIDGLGQVLDNGAPLLNCDYYPLYSSVLNPIKRVRVTKPFDVGIKAINGLLTVGVGQRIGIVAGTGVGKSVLLGMIANYAKADVVVVGLIGERSREVKEFIEENIGEAYLHRAAIIASPVDRSPLEHINAALVATSIAEYFRDKGANVVLIVDSLTRYAQALRKIYLTIGEMPSARGYSPSVFSKLSQLVERAGNGVEGMGSITAFYTILTEGDDALDPIADHARSVLDGHIILSRQLAEQGHYPAIDTNASISRVMANIVEDTQWENALKFKKYSAVYQQNSSMIDMGMYHAGANKLLDDALLKKDNMENFLTQGVYESVDFSTCVDLLNQVVS